MINELTQQELIDAINTKTMRYEKTPKRQISLISISFVSGIFLQEKNFLEFLGGVERNQSGHIVRAKATYIHWFAIANVTRTIDANRVNDESGAERENLGLDDNVDARTLEFEAALLKVLEEDCNLPNGLTTHANVQRSYGDISSGAIWSDVNFLIIGYCFVYLFVQGMMGRFNKVEQRVIHTYGLTFSFCIRIVFTYQAFLGLMALTNAQIAMLASFGFCSVIGLDFGPMHALIPCLLLGLGVDNAFVIVQEFNNAEDRDKSVTGDKKSLPERIGNGLRHAGVGITVTSMTDVIVFAVGGSTVLPSLRSYSLYTAMGILFTFFLQITFFVGWLTIDTVRNIYSSS